MERFSATATEVGVGGKEGVIGRDAGGAKRIKGGEAMVERANDLAAKKKAKENPAQPVWAHLGIHK